MVVKGNAEYGGRVMARDREGWGWGQVCGCRPEAVRVHVGGEAAARSTDSGTTLPGLPSCLNHSQSV